MSDCFRGSRLTVCDEFINCFSPFFKFIQGWEDERVALQRQDLNDCGRSYSEDLRVFLGLPLDWDCAAPACKQGSVWAASAPSAPASSCYELPGPRLWTPSSHRHTFRFHTSAKLKTSSLHTCHNILRVASAAVGGGTSWFSCCGRAGVCQVIVPLLQPSVVWDQREEDTSRTCTGPASWKTQNPQHVYLKML